MRMSQGAHGVPLAVDLHGVRVDHRGAADEHVAARLLEHAVVDAVQALQLLALLRQEAGPVLCDVLRHVPPVGVRLFISQVLCGL